MALRLRNDSILSRYVSGNPLEPVNSKVARNTPDGFGWAMVVLCWWCTRVIILYESMVIFIGFPYIVWVGFISTPVVGISYVSNEHMVWVVIIWSIVLVEEIGLNTLNVPPKKIETNSNLKWPGFWTPPQLVFRPEIYRPQKRLMQGYSWMLIRRRKKNRKFCQALKSCPKRIQQPNFSHKQQKALHVKTFSKKASFKTSFKILTIPYTLWGVWTPKTYLKHQTSGSSWKIRVSKCVPHTFLFWAELGRQKTGWKNNGTNLDGNLWLDCFGGCALFGCWEKDGSFEPRFFGKRFLGSESYEIWFGEDVDVMFFNEIHVCLVSLLTLINISGLCVFVSLLNLDKMSLGKNAHLLKPFATTRACIVLFRKIIWAIQIHTTRFLERKFGRNPFRTKRERYFLAPQPKHLVMIQNLSGWADKLYEVIGMISQTIGHGSYEPSSMMECQKGVFSEFLNGRFNLKRLGDVES